MKREMVPGALLVVVLALLVCLAVSTQAAGQEPTAAPDGPRDGGDVLLVCLALAGGTATLATVEWIRMVRRVSS